MFALDFWGADHFAGDYWGEGIAPAAPSGGGGHSPVSYRRTTHKPNPVTIDAGKRHVPAVAAAEWVSPGGGLTWGSAALVEVLPSVAVLAAPMAPMDAVGVPAPVLAVPAEVTARAIKAPAALRYVDDEDELVLLTLLDE